MYLKYFNTHLERGFFLHHFAFFGGKKGGGVILKVSDCFGFKETDL